MERNSVGRIDKEKRVDSETFRNFLRNTEEIEEFKGVLRKREIEICNEINKLKKEANLRERLFISFGALSIACAVGCYIATGLGNIPTDLVLLIGVPTVSILTAFEIYEGAKAIAAYSRIIANNIKIGIQKGIEEGLKSLLETSVWYHERNRK
jgi:hypothetical protein